MSKEFRLDQGSSLSVASALLLRLSDNYWWNGAAWVPAASLTTAQAYTSGGAAILPGTQETIGGGGWDGAYTFDLPASSPAGNYRAFIYATNPPALGAQVGWADYYGGSPTPINAAAPWGGQWAAGQNHRDYPHATGPALVIVVSGGAGWAIEGLRIETRRKGPLR